MHSAWKGIYLNGIKISDGYFNIQEIEKAERFLGEFGEKKNNFLLLTSKEIIRICLLIREHDY